jgi:hypothetical protein
MNHIENTCSIVVPGFIAAEMFDAPLRSNGRGADHSKHRSSIAVPLLRSCLLLRERAYRAVA